MGLKPWESKAEKLPNDFPIGKSLGNVKNK